MAEENIKPVGIDLGTSAIKLSSNQRKTLQKFPSIVGDPNPGFSGITIDDSLINNLILKDDKRTLYVGELALLQSEVKRPLIPEGRMKNVNNSLIAVKAALSLLLGEEEEGVNADEIILTTGAPIATSREEMEKLSAAISGTKKVHVINDATGKEKKLAVNIKRCLVLPEPYGCYYRMLVLTGETRAVDAVIIDIGHGSTDILSIYAGRMIRTASRSIIEAVNTLTERISKALTEQANKIIRPYELRKTIELGRDTLRIGNEILDISSAKSYYVKAISAVIADEVTRLIKVLPPDAWIEKIMMTGGGVHLFGEELIKQLVETGVVVSADEIILPDDAVMANAEGFEMIAERRLEQLTKDLMKGI